MAWPRLGIAVALQLALVSAACGGAPDDPALADAEFGRLDFLREWEGKAGDVYRFYAVSAGQVYDGLWLAPPDPQLAKETPGELVRWLGFRTAPLKAPHRFDAQANPAAGEMSDAGRVYVSLVARDEPNDPAAAVFAQRHAVLAIGLNAMCRWGDGPTGALLLHIQQLVRDYPTQSQAKSLYVEYCRALTAVIVRNAAVYARAAGLRDGTAFCGQVQAEARKTERARLEKLHELYRGSEAGAMAAIYLAEHYWDYGGAGQKTAEGLIEQYRSVWDANQDLAARAAPVLGRIVSAMKGLQDVTFVDTTGKRWTSDDFRGKNTLLVFFLPQGWRVLEQLDEAWQGKAQIVGVPVGTGPLAPARCPVVDRDRSNVEKLMASLGAREVPSTVLVTPSLRVINNVDRIREFLNEYGKPGKSGTLPQEGGEK